MYISTYILTYSQSVKDKIQRSSMFETICLTKIFSEKQILQSNVDKNSNAIWKVIKSQKYVHTY